MRQVKFLIIVAVTVMLSACENGNEDDMVSIEKGTYSGTVLVDQNDGTVYVQEDVSVILDVGADNVEIKMLQVSFSDKMPVRLDMTIPRITKTEIPDGLLLSGNEIIPLAMGGEFPRYTITNMDGKVTLQSLAFTLICGEYPLTFSGIFKQE